MPQMWIEGGIAILVEDSDIWPSIAETEEQETELGKEENWNIGTVRIMDKGGLKDRMKKII